jgi:hypothetical protein
MKLTGRTLVIVVVLVMLGCISQFRANDRVVHYGEPLNVMLIGWDGVQRNHLKECLARGEVPQLRALADEGALVAIDILRVTDTKAGWTQILTGYEPEVTGVFSNSQYGPIPEGYTVFERLESHFGPDNVVTVAVIGKKENVDADGPRRIVPKKEQAKQAQAKETKAKQNQPQQAKKNQLQQLQQGQEWEPAKPYFYTKRHMDLFLNGLGKAENVGTKTLELLDEYKNQRFFFFVHFADPDHAGHQHGENSAEYNQAIITCDEWLGRIVARLKELGLYGRTLIYVTADHGFDEGKKVHRDAPYVFLATNDAGIVRRGGREDIAPTILARFGLDVASIVPPLDGHPLTEPYEKPLW